MDDLICSNEIFQDLVTLVGSLLTFGLAGGAIAIIGLIKGILYLTKSDGQFAQKYVANKKPWF